MEKLIKNEKKPIKIRENIIVSFIIPKEVYKEAREVAKELGLSFSDFVRMTLFEKLKEERKNER